MNQVAREQAALAKRLVDQNDIIAAEKALNLITTLLNGGVENCKILMIGSRAHLLKKDYEHALSYAKKAITLRPDHALAFVVLGDAQMQSGNMKDSLISFKKATSLNPDLLSGQFGLLSCMNKLYRHNKNLATDILHCVDKILNLKPSEKQTPALVSTLSIRASIHRREKRFQACIDDCVRVLQYQPSNDSISFLLAAAKAAAAIDGVSININEDVETKPTGAPTEYISKLYDGYAAKFDKHLLHDLKYQTPMLLLQAMERHKLESIERTGDLGCGTGLCAKLLKEKAIIKATLVGCDLSRNMIEKAKLLGIYDELDVEGIEPWLAHQTPNSYDLLISSDVFVYFGKMEKVFSLVTRALTVGGLFVFSTETNETVETYELLPTRRFAHSKAYVHQICSSEHLEKVAIVSNVVLRYQAGEPVMGNLFLYRKA